MAKTVMPIAEKNPFLTGTHLAPATALSHQLGLKVELQDETENYDDDDDDLSGEGSECSDRVTQGNLGIDQSVREDMAKLEDTFEELGLRFRLIDRIGEGHLLF